MPENQYSLSLCLIKPGFNHCKEEIFGILQKANIRTMVLYESVKFSRELADLFYSEHRKKNFHDGNIRYISSGALTVFIAYKKGQDVIETVSELLRNPESGIRKKFGVDITKNVMHASDSRESMLFEVTTILFDTNYDPLDKLLYLVPAEHQGQSKKMGNEFVSKIEEEGPIS